MRPVASIAVGVVSFVLVCGPARSAHTSTHFPQAFMRQTFVSDPEFSAFVQSADFGKWLPQ